MQWWGEKPSSSDLYHYGNMLCASGEGGAKRVKSGVRIWKDHPKDSLWQMWRPQDNATSYTGAAATVKKYPISLRGELSESSTLSTSTQLAKWSPSTGQGNLLLDKSNNDSTEMAKSFEN